MDLDTFSAWWCRTIAYFGITQKDEIFGKKSFDNAQPRKVHKAY